MDTKSTFLFGNLVEVIDGTPVNGPKIWSSDMHGLNVVSVQTWFNQDENHHMGAIALNLKQWLTDYTQGWTYTIKTSV